MGFIIYYLVLIVNPMSRILVRWKSFRDNLERAVPPYPQLAVLGILSHTAFAHQTRTLEKLRDRGRERATHPPTNSPIFL